VLVDFSEKECQVKNAENSGFFVDKNKKAITLLKSPTLSEIDLFDCQECVRTLAK
jgi:hypothetical protein